MVYAVSSDRSDPHSQQGVISSSTVLGDEVVWGLLGRRPRIVTDSSRVTINFIGTVTSKDRGSVSSLLSLSTLLSGRVSFRSRVINFSRFRDAVSRPRVSRWRASPINFSRIGAGVSDRPFGSQGGPDDL